MSEQGLSSDTRLTSATRMRLKRVYQIAVAGLVVYAMSISAQANPNQCYKDTDCKGERICEQGVCSYPNTAHLPITSNRQPQDVDTSSTAKSSVPQFKDYPVAAIYTGAAAALANSNDDFRTRKTEALQQNEIVFAGEYVIATFGCGTGCRIQSLLSKKTGQELADGFGGEEGELIKAVKRNSRLLVTAGKHPDNPDDLNYYAMFYVLEHGRLKRIAIVPTTLPECEGMESYCTIESPY